MRGYTVNIAEQSLSPLSVIDFEAIKMDVFETVVGTVSKLS